jgi:hypothetical protein
MAMTSIKIRVNGSWVTDGQLQVPIRCLRHQKFDDWQTAA